MKNITKIGVIILLLIIFCQNCCYADIAISPYAKTPKYTPSSLKEDEDKLPQILVVGLAAIVIVAVTYLSLENSKKDEDKKEADNSNMENDKTETSTTNDKEEKTEE